MGGKGQGVDHNNLRVTVVTHAIELSFIHLAKHSLLCLAKIITHIFCVRTKVVTSWLLSHHSVVTLRSVNEKLYAYLLIII